MTNVQENKPINKRAEKEATWKRRLLTKNNSMAQGTVKAKEFKDEKQKRQQRQEKMGF